MRSSILFVNFLKANHMINKADTFFFLYKAIRIFLYPLLRYVLPFVNSSCKQRVSFELRNFREAACQSFKDQGIQADFAFEVSSEGELEQVKPVLSAALNRGYLVELVFSSSSVEKQCLRLAKESEEGANLRIFRYPLLTFMPGKRMQDPYEWISAKNLFLCRYDFFPSLLRYGRRKDVKFTLLSGSLKSFKKRQAGSLYRKLYSWIYQSFDQVVAATESDREAFETYFFSKGASHKESLRNIERSLCAFDFRPISIAKRLEKRGTTLESNFPAYNLFQKNMERYPIHERFVFGSFWDYELKAFESPLDWKRFFICIFPHRLDQENIDVLKTGLAQRVNAPVYELGKDEAENTKTLEDFALKPGPIIINLKGVLCESYCDFGSAFVGGGHGVSVHSLLEPYMGGAKVYCGPKVGRSTEFDLIHELSPDRITIVDRLENLFETLTEDSRKKVSNIDGFSSSYLGSQENILNWLGIAIKDH